MGGILLADGHAAFRQALAIVLASELGVSDDAMQRALDDWQPAKWRGEFRHDGQRLLYLDFYNANPASMSDALDAFADSVPAEDPRLYVLGCMEELGPDAEKYHRELGRSLRLRAQDRAFVIGSFAEGVADGAAEAGLPAGAVEVVSSLEPVAASIAAFRGSVFMKGSRRYELERALPPEVAGSKSGGSSPGFGAGGLPQTFSRSPLGAAANWQPARPATRSPIRTSASPFV